MKTPTHSKEQLQQLAVEAHKKAYAPYSGYSVGATVLMEDGKTFSGCNVENASYGGTICAERVAITKAVSEGSKRILEIAVVTDSAEPWPPCGFCRQVMAEFSIPGRTLVHMCNLQGVKQTMTFDELLPKAFTPRHLGK